jgi:hypothetical protein
MKGKTAIVFIFILFLAAGLFAQTDNLTLKIAVVGPGDQLYFWWGHIALIIEDSRTGRSYFYDYGIFDFNQENFFYNFALGRLLYRCGVSPTSWNMNVYKRANREVIFYTLDVSREAKIKVKELAEFNILPENREYYYHHFRDNCSTRIRDIIDLATGGQFLEQFENKPSRFTLRQHVRRHTWFFLPADWFLNFLMGQVIDTPISVWDEMFLPAEVGNWIENFWYTDENGEKRKLVSSIETVLTSEGRPMILDEPKRQWPFYLTFSLFLSVLFGFFFFLQAKGKSCGKISAGISMSICSLIFGIAGSMLYFMSLFTDHDYTFQNINMIFCSPLLLAGVPFGIIYAISNKNDLLIRCSFLLRLLWLITVLGIIISLALRLLPWFYQDNNIDKILMLPIALVFVFQPVLLKESLSKYFPFIDKRRE